MFSAQYGNHQAYYGNILYASYYVPLFKWGAWELPHGEHYQLPLTKKEEKVIDVHREYTPASIAPQENNESIIMRMRHEALLQEMQNAPVIAKQQTPLKREHHNHDDEESFILI